MPRRSTTRVRASRGTWQGILGAMLVLASAVWLTACGEPEPQLQAAVHLVENLDDVVGLTPGTQLPRVSWIEIGFDRRRALFQHPPKAYRFSGVAAGNEASLHVAPAMAPRSWDKGTDGVEFTVTCLDAAGRVRILDTLDLKPRQRREDRTWMDRKISLAPCAASTTLELRTSCGPADDCRWDAAFWGDPRIVRPRQFDSEVDRLVLLISIDTLRPDRMGLYGADRPTTPHLDALALDAVVFETTVAPAPWTVPSHASLLTSTDPDVHGATTSRDIHPDLPLISDVLRGAGWATAGFVDTPWLGRFGFPRGFDHYDADEPPPGGSVRGAAVTKENLLRWLGRADGDAFVFWHVMDVHGPYGAPAPFGGRFRRNLEIVTDDRLRQLTTLGYHDYLQLERFRSLEDMKAAYDEGIAHVDAEVGDLLASLKSAGLYENALIVVTSDHGESFMDHGIWVGHGLFLTDDEIQVPLIVKLPGNRHAGSRVEEMVRLIDVAPTILDAVGVAPSPSYHGRSLASPAPGDPRALPRAAFGASTHTGAEYVRTNGAKLITAWRKPRQQVIETHLRPRDASPLTSRIESEGRRFDLVHDSKEETNLLPTDEGAALAEELGRLLARRSEWVDGLVRRLDAGDEEPNLTPEETNRLRTLGYLGGT